MDSAITSVGESCCAGCINLTVVVVVVAAATAARTTNTILWEVFLNYHFVRHVGFDDYLTKNLHSEEN